MNDDEAYPAVFDLGDGIKIEIPISDGITIGFFLDDEAAQEFVDIIQNKLNARE